MTPAALRAMLARVEAEAARGPFEGVSVFGNGTMADILRLAIAEAERRSTTGGHYYPGCDYDESRGHGDFFTSDCIYRCGSWMGSSRSGSRGKNVDQWGACPGNPLDIRCPVHGDPTIPAPTPETMPSPGDGSADFDAWAEAGL